MRLRGGDSKTASTSGLVVSDTLFVNDKDSNFSCVDKGRDGHCSVKATPLDKEYDGFTTPKTPMHLRRTPRPAKSQRRHLNHIVSPHSVRLIPWSISTRSIQRLEKRSGLNWKLASSVACHSPNLFYQLPSSTLSVPCSSTPQAWA